MGKQKKVKERDLYKALNDLENLAKGDALEDADPEGGMSTQGKPLSDKAPKGRGDSTKKSKAAASSSSAASSSMDKADAASDDDSDEGSGDDSGDDDSGENNDESSEDMGKSFRDVAEDDEEISKGLLVSPFLESLVDRMSGTMDDLAKSINTRIDRRFESQQEFNVRLAKGLVLVGRTMNQLLPLVKEQAEVIKSFGNSPSIQQRKSVLSKSEVVEPDGHGGGDDDPASVKPRDIEDWLINKAQAGEIPLQMVTTWETSGRSLAGLPLPIRKALMNDLAKAR